MRDIKYFNGLSDDIKCILYFGIVSSSVFNTLMSSDQIG